MTLSSFWNAFFLRRLLCSPLKRSSLKKFYFFILLLFYFILFFKLNTLGSARRFPSVIVIAPPENVNATEDTNFVRFNDSFIRICHRRVRISCYVFSDPSWLVPFINGGNNGIEERWSVPFRSRLSSIIVDYRCFPEPGRAEIKRSNRKDVGVRGGQQGGQGWTRDACGFDNECIIIITSRRKGPNVRGGHDTNKIYTTLVQKIGFSCENIILALTINFRHLCIV